MGLQHRLERSRLGLEETSPTIEAPDTEVVQSSSICRTEDVGERRNRAYGADCLPIDAIQRPEERQLREKGYFRLVQSKQVYHKAKVQDDNSQSSTSGPTQRRLDVLNRPERCLLAHPSGTPLQPVPGIPTGEGNLQVCSYALRTMYSASYLHKSDEHSGPGTSQPGHLHYRVPGRSAPRFLVKRRMSNALPTGSRIPEKERLPYKHKEVSLDPGKMLHMARPPMVDTLLSSVSPYRQTKINSNEHKFLHKLFPHNKKEAGATHGVSTICLYSGPSSEEQTENNQSVLQTSRSFETPRSPTGDATVSQEASDTMDLQKGLGRFDSSSPSSSFHPNTHGCFDGGMGIPLGRGISYGQMVREFQEFPHKHTGTHNRFPESQSEEPSQGLTHSSFFRQHDSGLLPQKRRLPVLMSEFLGPLNIEIPQTEESVPFGFSHSGSNECSGRQPFTPNSHGIRVVSRHSIIPPDSEHESMSRSGPLRNSGEPQTPDVCRSQLRLSRNSEGCILDGLESVEDNISLPPSVADFEGFEQSGVFPRDSLPGGSQMAIQDLVLDTGGNEPAVHSFTSVPLSEGWKRDCLRYILSPHKPSRLDFLKKIYTAQYSRASAQYLIGHLRHSSAKQYESTWSQWTTFLHGRRPSSISKETVLSFCIFLFEEKQIAVRTIMTYKSALKEPLLRGFGVDVSSDDFTSLVKAFSLKRPAAPSRFPTWSLDNVLDILHSENYNTANISLLLEKTLFLTALACGPRVSELRALRRGQFISRENGCMTLSPDPVFLAKNEDPLNRRRSICIRPIHDRDKSLCPVKSLEDYLAATASSNSDSLFLSSHSGSALTLGNLRFTLARLIRKAQPGSFPKSHDLRKLASSLAFFGNMPLPEISAYTGWSSKSVFIRHYLGEIKELRNKCVAMGQTVGPLQHGA